MGDVPLRIMEKLNQATPSIRQGIVSSVYPFAVPDPNGFTIDIMQQGGSSGSPILNRDGTVVGMMASGLLDHRYINLGDKRILMPFPANMSVAVPAHIIAAALDDFPNTEYAGDTAAFPTFDEWKSLHDSVGADTMQWIRA